MISPTPGRIVWYWPAANDNIPSLLGEPLAAIVAAAHHDYRINLCVIDAYGNQHSRQNVRLVQPEEEVNLSPGFAQWMPYQVGQAAKTEQVEQQLTASQVGFVNEQITDSVTQSTAPDDAAPSSSEPVTGQ